MSTQEFVLQGFTTRTHADVLREMLDIPDIRAVTLSVAFVSEGGVQEIEEKLRGSAANITAFAGIRNDITSCQGLKQLYSVASGSLYIVDTGARSPVFHPKLYLVRGETQARLMVGSANLTLGGLNNNIEASVILGFDLANNEDKIFVEGVETLLANLTTAYPSNIVKVRSVAEIDDLLLAGRITDELAFVPPRQRTVAAGTHAADTIPRIKLKVRHLSRLPSTLRAARQTMQASQNPPPQTSLIPFATAGIGDEFELVWESKPLTRRDLGIPDEDGTNETGSINLDKGLLPAEIDHRHYFREEIFAGLVWSPARRTTEEAYAKFQVVVKGTDYGEFDLRIGHTIGTTSVSYRRHNAMTRLSWGPAQEYVARPDLLERMMRLYRDKADQNRFLVEID